MVYLRVDYSYGVSIRVRKYLKNITDEKTYTILWRLVVKTNMLGAVIIAVIQLFQSINHLTFRPFDYVGLGEQEKLEISFILYAPI